MAGKFYAVFACFSILCTTKVTAGHYEPRFLPPLDHTVLEDLHSAVISAQDVAVNSMALQVKIANLQTAVMAAVMKDMLKVIVGLATLGVPESELASLRSKLELAILNTQKTVASILENTKTMAQIGARTGNDILFHRDRLRTDLDDLQTAIMRMEADFLAGVVATVEDSASVHAVVLALLQGLSGAAGNEIRVALEQLEKDLIAEYESIVASFNTTIGAAANCIVAITKVIAHFGL